MHYKEVQIYLPLNFCVIFSWKWFGFSPMEAFVLFANDAYCRNIQICRLLPQTSVNQLFNDNTFHHKQRDIGTLLKMWCQMHGRLSHESYSISRGGYRRMLFKYARSTTVDQVMSVILTTAGYYDKRLCDESLTAVYSRIRWRNRALMRAEDVSKKCVGQLISSQKRFAQFLTTMGDWRLAPKLAKRCRLGKVFFSGTDDFISTSTQTRKDH